MSRRGDGDALTIYNLTPPRRGMCIVNINVKTFLKSYKIDFGF